MTIEENVPLAPMTTLEIGGPARYFAEAKRESEVCEAVEFARSHNFPLFILGGGSNLVVSDSGWSGLVLRIALGGLGKEEAGATVRFTAGAGQDWDGFVAEAVAQNCAGIECLSGIPGTVGGTPVQNVGAYGQEVAETIESVRVFDTKEGGISVLTHAACGFRYRRSIFNTSERGRYIILSVTYRLKQGGVAQVRYADLQKYFSESGGATTLAAVRDAVRQIRRSKGMLLVPGDEESHSAGSFFKNPVLSEEQFKDLRERAALRGLRIPSYPALDSQHKVSAAWLVEQSGFAKGFREGAAGISGKHALALVNRGGAQASDIIRLKDRIQKQVHERWGISLETEPVFVGF
jgi:UDP-N-acetylmuramate dehydrogenase